MEVDSLVRLSVGGADQWVSVRGCDESNPIMLFLQGGPGMPTFPFMREIGERLEHEFTVAYWEQRGVGKSYSRTIPSSSMTIKQYVSDLLEIVGYLRRAYDTERLYLLGHSWGTVIGMLAAQRRPEAFRAYVGIGQVVSMPAGEPKTYHFALDSATKAGNRRAVDQLKATGPPPYDHADMLTVRKWVTAFGGAIHAARGRRAQYRDLIRLATHVPRTPEYSTTDLLALRDPYFAQRTLWPELARIDLSDRVPELAVPVYFLEGRHDWICPVELTEQYYGRLEAPAGKNLIWFENSAHSPHREEPNRAFEVLTNTVRAETLTS